MTSTFIKLPNRLSIIARQMLNMKDINLKVRATGHWLSLWQWVWLRVGVRLRVSEFELQAKQ